MPLNVDPPPDVEAGDIDASLDAVIEGAVESPAPRVRGTRRSPGNGAGVSRADISVFARGGTLVLLGNGFYGVMRLAFTIAVARALGVRETGVLVSVIALISILSNTAELGADTGVSRFIPQARVEGRSHELRRIVDVALLPVILGGGILGLLTFIFAPQLSQAFVHGASRAHGVVYLRVFAVAVPLLAALRVALAATRGMGTMVPYVAILDVGLPVLRLVPAMVALVAGLGAVAFAFGWMIPAAISFVAAMLAMYALIRKAQATEPATAAPPRPFGRLAKDFWAFSTPRAIATLFQVTVFGLDVLLLGALATSAQAAVYGAAGRIAVMGTFALAAAGIPLAPQIAHLLARGSRDRAEAVFQAATWWIMVASWPFGLAVAVYAPLIMRVYGRGFPSGHTALSILSLAMLVQIGTGNNRIVLLMGGKSLWNLLFSGLALVTNVVLNVILIPRYGMNGAAIAWAITILVDNGGTTFAVWKLLDIQPFGRSYGLVMALTLGCYGVIGVVVRSIFGLSMPSGLLYLAIATAVYLPLLWRYRGALHLSVLRELLHARRLVSSPASFDPVG